MGKSIAVRTFTDWKDPPPGYFEMDMVAHCGKSVAGSYTHSLVLTDIASTWTVAAAMVMREQTLVTATVEEIRKRLPFPCSGWIWTITAPSSMKLWSASAGSVELNSPDHGLTNLQRRTIRRGLSRKTARSFAVWSVMADWREARQQRQWPHCMTQRGS